MYTGRLFSLFIHFSQPLHDSTQYDNTLVYIIKILSYLRKLISHNSQDITENDTKLNKVFLVSHEFPSLFISPAILGCKHMYFRSQTHECACMRLTHTSSPSREEMPHTAIAALSLGTKIRVKPVSRRCDIHQLSIFTLPRQHH